MPLKPLPENADQSDVLAQNEQLTADLAAANGTIAGLRARVAGLEHAAASRPASTQQAAAPKPGAVAAPITAPRNATERAIAANR